VVGYNLFSEDFYTGECKNVDLYASYYATYGILNAGVWEYTFDTSDTDILSGRIACDPTCDFCNKSPIDCVTCADST